LQGETVCNLHVANNLRLLTPLESLKKGNRVQDMPDAPAVEGVKQ
jgi:hypothetical protein